jgi:hypothetical protein
MNREKKNQKKNNAKRQFMITNHAFYRSKHFLYYIAKFFTDCFFPQKQHKYFIIVDCSKTTTMQKKYKTYKDLANAHTPPGDMFEDSCMYVSSRGFAKWCDIKSSVILSSFPVMTDVIEKLSTVPAKNTVYVCNSAVIQNHGVILRNLNEPIILVSGDSDDTVNEDVVRRLKPLIESPKIIKWYSQNYTSNHPKIFRLPIGLDYHSDLDMQCTLSPFQHECILKSIVKESVPFSQRPLLCYSNFHFCAFRHKDRVDAIVDFPENLVYYERDRLERFSAYKKQSCFAFVISPHGRGLDCHRTWEALILGCIPIVKTSALDSLYEDLPVLIVNQWSDVTKELLSQTVTAFANREYAYEKLTLEYWKQQIMV